MTVSDYSTGDTNYIEQPSGDNHLLMVLTG